MPRPSIARPLLTAVFGLLSTMASVSGATTGATDNPPPAASLEDPLDSVARRDGRVGESQGAWALSSPRRSHDSSVSPSPWPAQIRNRLVELRREFEHSGATARNRIAAATQPADDTRLTQRLRSVLARRAAGTRVGVHVRTLDSTSVVFDANGDLSLNPASNQKLVTAVAAIELLGADYRFETQVRAADDALYLVGQGDPSLQIVDLERLASRVAERVDLASIRTVVIDDSAFSDRRFGPGYASDGPAMSYAAPSSAFALAFNTVEVEVRPGAFRAAPIVQVRPGCGGVEIDNRARTGSGKPLDIHASVVDGRTKITVQGSIVAGHAPVLIRRRIHHPAAYVGACFSELLAEHVHRATWTVLPGLTPPAATPIAAHESAPLAVVLASALQYSNNLTSEQVLRTLGWRTTGRAGTWRDGIASVEAFWRTIGGDPDELHVENGSGLSRNGRATAQALVRTLELTQRPNSPAAALRDAMAVPGEDGTMRLRLTRLSDRLRAKTGTIAGVSALSGIVANRDGRDAWAFSILVNGGHARDNRRLQDRLVLAMVDHLDAPH